MNEQLEKIKSDLDAIRKHPLVSFGMNYHNGKEIQKTYHESDKNCGGRISFNDNIVSIAILSDDYFETVVDVLMKSYQFIEQAERLRIHRLSSPSFKEALSWYISSK